MSSSPAIGVISAAAIRPTRVEIDLEAVRANADLLAGIAGVGLFAVVKADAYGHGAVRVAKALEGRPGVAGFAVSLVEEGSQLRDAGIRAPVLVMGPALEGGYGEMVGRDMLAMVTSPRDLEALSEIGRNRGQPVPVHVKIDTGMGRLGIAPTRATELLRAAHGVEVGGVATHLACAETDDPADGGCMTNRQLVGLRDAVTAIRGAGFVPRLIHAANSAGTLRFPTARLDRVRTGLAVYGNGGPAPTGSLRQAMRLVTEVVQLRRAEAGSTVSYGALWRAERPSLLAVLPVGYADGVTRRLTEKAEVLIRGRRCPTVGAISMDITIVDVTELAGEVEVGDEAVLLGAQDGETIRCAELAERAGLVEYEVTCNVSKRVPRVYR